MTKPGQAHANGARATRGQALVGTAETKRALYIEQPVLAEIKRTVGSRPSEQGGALGGSREDGVVRYFHFDETARRTGATYPPDHETLNRLFRDDWNPR